MCEREEHCLNGLWDFCPGDGTLDKLPEVWEETKIKVPSPWNINSFAGPQKLSYGNEKIFLRGGEFDLYPEYPKAWEDAKSGWYKTEFFVSDAWKGRIILLTFKAVLFYSEFYINGIKISTDCDGFLPHEFSIQEVINYSAINTIVVGVKKQELFKFKDENSKNKIEYPTGSFWGMTMGGIWQDVFLKVLPPAYIADAFIYTSIDDKHLTIELELNSFNIDKFQFQFVLREFKGTRSFSLGSQAIYNKKTKFEYDYSEISENIKLWWPEAPELYYLEVYLKAGEKTLDFKTLRFGFRKFEIIGKKFYLNNTPINLRNDSWHYMGFACQTEEYAKLWYKMAKAANVNTIRLHAQVYPEFFLDIADEMGMLIVDETSIWASHCEFHYSMKFIENGKKHLERLIKRDRNHPSVIIWSVENECVMAYRVSADNGVINENELNERLFMLAEEAMKLDPTRPVSGDGSNDMGGRIGIYSLHYPNRTCSISTSKPITIGEMGSLYYSTPDFICNIYGEKTYETFEGRLEAISRELFECIKQQRKWAAQVCVFNLVWYGLQPLPFKEQIKHYATFNTPGIKSTKTGKYISTLNAGFDETLPEYLPNTVFKWVQSAYIPERFFFEAVKSRYYNGENGKISITIFNDSYIEKEYDITWSLGEQEESYCEYSQKVTVKPSEYVLKDLTFELPSTERINKSALSIIMKFNNQVIYTDQTVIIVYNKEYVISRLKKFGDVCILGSSDPKLLQFFNNTGVYFDNKNTKKGMQNYLIAGKLETGILSKLENKKIFDFMPAENEYAPWLSHKSVEKAFINVNSEILKQELDEEDLSDWERGIVSDYSFRESFTLNKRNIVATGKGLPLILDNLDGTNRRIVSTIELLKYVTKEPAALVLLANLVEYAAVQNSIEFHSCILVSKKASALAEFMKSAGVIYTLLDPDDKQSVKGLTGVKVLIVDGSYPFEYINELLPINVEKLVICNLQDENIPFSLKGYIEIVKTPLNQLIKCNGSPSVIEGIHLGDLYGLEAGNEVQISESPIFIKDKSKVTGILKNSNINWRMWNNQGEDRKIVSILRSEAETKQELYGLAETTVNTISTILCQLTLSGGSRKQIKLFSTILTNLGIKLNIKAEDDFDKIVEDGIYENAINKCLLLHSLEVKNSKELKPAVNTEENGTLWKIAGLNEGQELPAGFLYYAVYIYSETDRTDLLLNPDLIGVRIENESEKELYLNENLVSTGKDIVLKALQLKTGWNKFIVKEKRERQDIKPVAITFKRKDNDSLDLKFALEPRVFKEISNEQWKLSSNYNAIECENSIKGRGFFWSTIETQEEGMYFQADLGGVYDIAKMQFNSRMEGDCILMNTPRSFSILSSLDGHEWNKIYTAKDEEQLSIVDGKVIIYFHKQSFKYIKLVLNNVALKPLAISELRMFTYEE